MLKLVFYARHTVKKQRNTHYFTETKNKNCQVHAIISFVSFHYPILTFNYLSNWSSIPISLSSFIPKSSPTQKQRKWEQESHAEIIARKFYSLFFFSFLLNCGFGNGCCCHCNSLMKTLQACMHRGVYEAVKCKKQLFLQWSNIRCRTKHIFTVFRPGAFNCSGDNKQDWPFIPSFTVICQPKQFSLRKLSQLRSQTKWLQNIEA